MVSHFVQQPFYRAANLTVDTSHAQQRYFDTEEKSVLDDSILDHSTVDSALEFSPPMAASRRESFAVSSALFSPKTEDWPTVDMQSLPSNNPFADQHSNTSNNPFTRLDHGQNHVFGPHTGGHWMVDHVTGSAAATPFQPSYDNVSTDYEASASIFSRQLNGQGAFGNATGNVFASINGGDQSAPTSPQKDWMSSGQASSKKTRPGSPVIRSHNDLRRGDGIRKKNARFEIPAERNLSNIDQLIAQTTDEQEIKELKQQKRLLRNRQAALDSRQRKKQHTERLEDEKKQFTVIVNELEEENSSLKAKIDQLLNEKQAYVEWADAVALEKDELIREHTIETGALRKKVNVLTEHVQRLESSSMSSAALHGNRVFSSTYDDMDDMTMTNAWDNNSFLNDYAPETPAKSSVAVVAPKKQESTSTSEGDKGASQGGLLFMLFLVGAFVMSSRSTPAIPRVSEDVRAASATLLDNVFKDAGVHAQSGLQAMAPQPSGASWSQPALTGPVSGMSVAPSMLDELGDSLTQPSEEQTNEQIFSLSAAQYNGVHSQDFMNHAPQRSTSHGRKNLAAALATMRADKQTGAAEVYTRSLLWDQIPSEVVRNFAKMLSECNNAQNEQAQCSGAT
ncbi:hypothetical protein CDD81_4348 [Ophiocordyceps australis]|uniref:BZIP domain-containing protein n=1 Tax=Ophiocordyceps australis TaxID=1399860 RepID=A0A2C5XAG7_9HYPO|nr:hypothetical protein CDD81_4348 [Ophiocordyceps australis]